MLQVYQSGKRVINVDESWLPSADFRQRRWKRRGMLNTAPDKLLSQKINIITAMSSDGEVWVSLTTCKTDSNVLMLFMTRFAKLLRDECEGWRDNTVLLLDGVSRYFQSLTCSTHLGLVPQVRREPSLLYTSGSANSAECSIQLRHGARRALVRSSQAGRHQPHQHRLRQAVSASTTLIFVVRFGTL